MPFNSAGVYTPATGATSATAGDVIRSATWNAIFTDITAALTLLGQQLYGTTTVTTTPYVPIAADAFILVNRAGAVVINLPSIASRGGYPLAIKDLSGAANVNNITINRNGSDTIEAGTSLTINTAYGGFNLYPTTGKWLLHP